MAAHHSASFSFTLEVTMQYSQEARTKLLTVMGKENARLVNFSHISENNGYEDVIIEFYATSVEHGEKILKAINKIKEISSVCAHDTTFSIHQGGKIEVIPTCAVENKNDLAMAYTPGVARVCMAIHKDKDAAFDLTIRRNCVAVVSDGSAVLGLGNIGPHAAMPVMEGKAVLFKAFGGVDAFPLCINTQNTAEIIDFVEKVAPTFGGVNLEDIAAPRCFEIEQELKKRLDIPVFHDDQHGTAVVALAALFNALKINGKKMKDLKVVLSGFGAAGVACAEMFYSAGVRTIIPCDTKGIVYKGRKEGMNPVKEKLAEKYKVKTKGTLADAIKGADVFLGVSGPGVLKREYVETMAPKPIIFAMANPIPEILPEEIADLDAIVATGRSDYPNQINNVLCFPGIFRGALNCLATDINEDMKLAAAKAIASCVSDDELCATFIMPSPFNGEVAEKVAAEVEKAAIKTKVARLVD